jgi:hypothetical protein
MTKEFVCPLPMKWNEVWQILDDAREARGDPEVPPPPVPPILAAWHVPALWKMVRWRETLEWAEKHGFLHLIPQLEDHECFFLGD